MQTTIRPWFDIPTPTQPAIYKASVGESQKMQRNFEEILYNDNWALHFDGRKLKKQEMQVVVLKNQDYEVRLAALTLSDGKALILFI